MKSNVVSVIKKSLHLPPLSGGVEEKKRARGGASFLERALYNGGWPFSKKGDRYNGAGARAEQGGGTPRGFVGGGAIRAGKRHKRGAFLPPLRVVVAVMRERLGCFVSLVGRAALAQSTALVPNGSVMFTGKQRPAIAQRGCSRGRVSFDLSPRDARESTLDSAFSLVRVTGSMCSRMRSSLRAPVGPLLAMLLLVLTCSCPANISLQPVGVPAGSSWFTVHVNYNDEYGSWDYYSPMLPVTQPATGIWWSSALTYVACDMHLYGADGQEMLQSLLGQAVWNTMTDGRAYGWGFSGLKAVGVEGEAVDPFATESGSGLTSDQAARLVSDLDVLRSVADPLTGSFGWLPFELGFASSIPFVVFYLYRRMIARGMGHVQ